MNEIVKLYKENPVRIIEKDGEPWFVAKDVCNVLDLANPRSSMAFLDEDERGVHSMAPPSAKQEMAIISEAGLYSLILRSRKQAHLDRANGVPRH